MRDGKDVEGRCRFKLNCERSGQYLANHDSVDYNAWIESDQGRKLAASLDKDVVLAEGKLMVVVSYVLTLLLIARRTGYKEYKTGRTYMAKMGDWRKNAHEEIELDGIGGVNILVKADVHRSGMASPRSTSPDQY